MTYPDLEELTQKENALFSKMMVNGYFEQREKFNQHFSIYDQW